MENVSGSYYSTAEVGDQSGSHQRRPVDSNLRFDQSLRSRDPSWGVRNLEDVTEVAEKEGLELLQTVEMPANNLCVIYRKR